MHNREYISPSGRRFEWSEAKAELNFRKHALSFETAAAVFDGPTVEWPDDRRVYGEKRMIVCGLLKEKICVTIVYTERSEAIRLISARRASREERRRLETSLLKAADH